MILNVSGRTDIVAFYSEWFLNRYKEGFLDVRNPFYPKQVSRISFEDVDTILFCTKNPIPIVSRLQEINKPILFQITLTPYKNDIEPNVPSKAAIIEAIKKVSEIIGIENTYVRYDPIYLSKKYSVEYHMKAFCKMCELLDGYIRHIIVSFIDDYKNVRKNMSTLNFRDFSESDYEKIGLSFSKYANDHGMTVQTCFEDRRLIEYGFVNQDCITKELASRLTGKTSFRRWKSRKENKCDCVEMVDIGVYNSCNHLCKYCYANYDEEKVLSNMMKHNKGSSLLIGELEIDDIIKIRS